MMRTRAWIAIWLAALLLAPAAIAESETDAYRLPVPNGVPDKPWWETFDDPVLTGLIETGFAANPDLNTLEARLEQARYAAWQTLAPVLPQISVELNGRESAIEALGSRTIDQMKLAGEDIPDSYRSGTAYLVGTLNVDLFGKRILNHIGSRRDTDATRIERDATAAALAATIAQAYFDVLAGREQTRAVTTQIRANEELLELIELRYRRGDAEGLDVLQQRQQLATTATQLPLVEALTETARIELTVLLGRETNDPVALPDRPLPTLTGDVPVGRPSDLVDNRPDLRAAKKSVDAESAREKSTVMGFLPTLQIYGQTGWQASEINDVESEFLWEVGAGASIPLIMGGGNIAAYRQARAAGKAARLQLERLRLEAERAVETALVAQRRARRRLDAYRTQNEAASLAFDQSRERYLLGISSYQAVLTALTTLQQSELGMIDAKADLINSRIQLLDAVGGPWTEDLANRKGTEQ